MASLDGLRASIESIASKAGELRSVIAALREGAVVQEAIDDLQTRVDEIDAELAAIIDEAKGQGGNEIPPEEPPEATTLPA